MKYRLWLTVVPRQVPVDVESDTGIQADLEGDGTDLSSPFRSEIYDALNKAFGGRNNWSYYKLASVEAVKEKDKNEE